jgi:hypothetical protein
MLARKRKIVAYTGLSKNLSVMMEPSDNSLDRIEAILSEIGASNKIAEVQE